MSDKSTPEVFGSTGAALIIKKSLTNNSLGHKRPLLKKILNQKFTNASTIKNIYINNMKLKKHYAGDVRKSSKMRLSGKLRKKPTKGLKRREHNPIDLTLDHHDDNSFDSYSDLEYTSEKSLPPLGRSSHLGSKSQKANKNHERYSRSHERSRDAKALNANAKMIQKKPVTNARGSNLNSIVVNEHSVKKAL
jgi:hypothetical protein